MCDTSNALVRSLVIWDHTMLPVTRQRWFSRLYPQHIAGTHLSTPEGWKAELTWVAGYAKMVYPQTVTHPSINRARRRVTPLIETNALPLSQATEDMQTLDLVYKNVPSYCSKHCNATIQDDNFEWMVTRTLTTAQDSSHIQSTRSQAVARIADRTAKNCRGHVN